MAVFSDARGSLVLAYARLARACLLSLLASPRTLLLLAAVVALLAAVLYAAPQLSQ